MGSWVCLIFGSIYSPDMEARTDISENRCCNMLTHFRHFEIRLISKTLDLPRVNNIR